MKMETRHTARKVKGAGGGGASGAGIGASLAIVVVAVLKSWGIEIGPIEEGAVVVLSAALISALGAWWIGYQTRPHIRDKIEAE